MKKKLLIVILLGTMGTFGSAEIAYGVSGKFAMGYSSTIENQNLANFPKVSLGIFPNPSALSASIQWAALPFSNARLSIFNLKGELVRTFEAQGTAGRITWDGRNFKGAAVASGVYMVRLTAGKLSLNKTLVLCR